MGVRYGTVLVFLFTVRWSRKRVAVLVGAGFHMVLRLRIIYINVKNDYTVGACLFSCVSLNFYISE